ncbi:MAG: Lipopolysaccharide export system permease protein LptG [Catillopecten margaritatus gill symbiont]|uniref:Lipopolysaccharide export system permease protein LptG n=1 Tax=Catillopecten margaritatus gill symbiont TaxID=3083288 RepID=A0AAU6PG45_9GAMM
MNILNRYIAKTLLMHTLAVMAVWLGIYTLFNFINQVDSIGQHNYTALSALIYVMADLPSVVYAHSLVIILLGCLLGLGHLAATSQLIVIRGGGISIMQIAQRVTGIALIFILIVSLLGELIAPTATEYAESYRDKSLGRSVSTSSQQGFWLKDKNTILNVKKNFDGRSFGGVTLIQTNKAYRLDAVLHSDKASLNGKQLNLEKTKHYQLKQAEKFTTIQSQNHQEYGVDVSFDQRLINTLKKEPQELSIVNLYKHMVFLSSNNLASKAFEVELYKRLVKPITLVAMLMLSMLFIFGSLRDATLGKKIFLGIVISLFFELSSRLGSVISLRFDYDPLFSASAPTLITLGVAYLLLKRKSLGV